MKNLILTFILISVSNVVFGQASITFSNGDVLQGDVKSLENGIVVIETDYSENDFTMDWDEVTDFTSDSDYLINLDNGEKLDGKVSVSDKQATITLEDGSTKSLDYLDIVYMNSVSDGFWAKMSISLDGGFTLSKASNNTQLSIRGSAAYESTKINPDIYFQFVESSIDDENGNPIKTSRDNYGANFKYFIGKSWFAIAGADYLESDEMQLDLRQTYKLGIGYYPLRTYRMYLNASTGLALNEEAYLESAMTEDRSSGEAYAGLNYNAFGLNDISISAGIVYFPSLTEAGRNRVNTQFDIKFDLPRDFYIGGGFTYNYDSEPGSEDISKTDYVIQTSIGWSL